MPILIDQKTNRIFIYNMKIINIILLLILGSINIFTQALSEDELHKANLHTEYATREIMKNMFIDTEKYIKALNNYIQTLESPRFQKNSEEYYKKFIEKYNIFVNEFNELEKQFKILKMDEKNQKKLDEFNKQLKKVDDVFTETTKEYTKTFRGINRSLTKLDNTKLMYTDAEIFKTYSKITVRSLNHLSAVDKIIEIMNIRAEECGTITGRDDFYNEAMDKIKESHEKIEEICDNYPLSILKREEYNKLNEDYEKVKDYFQDSIIALKKFEDNLMKKYQYNKINYDKRFKKACEMIKQLPFRISEFFVPNCLITLITTLVIFIHI